MKLNRIAATAATAAAAIALLFRSGGHPTRLSPRDALRTIHTPPLPTPPLPTVFSPPSRIRPRRAPPPAKGGHLDRSLAWLVSRGGQAQVVFNHDVDVMAVDLQIESHSPTVANHLAFEADARVVRAQAEKILSTRALLPTHNRAAYKQMLKDFIVVANLLQPGPGYGTTPQDYAA